MQNSYKWCVWVIYGDFESLSLCSSFDSVVVFQYLWLSQVFVPLPNSSGNALNRDLDIISKCLLSLWKQWGGGDCATPCPPSGPALQVRVSVSSPFTSSCHVEFSAAWLGGVTPSVTEFKHVALQLNKHTRGSEAGPDLNLDQFTSGSLTTDAEKLLMWLTKSTTSHYWWISFFVLS